MLRLTDEEYKNVFSKTPRLCVDLLVKERNDTFLLTKRDIEPFKGLWHFPGGRVGYKESIEDAARRIAKAELGIDISIGKFIGYCDILNDGEYIHSVSLVLEVSASGGTIVGSDQAKEVTWFSSAPDNTHPYHKDFLRRIGKQ